MDQDDISLPHRLQCQVNHLDRHPSNGVVGGQILKKKDKIISWKYPISSSAITCRCAFGVPFAHPAVMMRRELVDYRPGYDYAEDWDLWDRLVCKKARWANLENPILSYRENSEGMSRKKNSLKDKAHRMVSTNILQRLGIATSEMNVMRHLGLTQPIVENSVPDTLSLLKAMWLANNRYRVYPRLSFAFECSRWMAYLLKRKTAKTNSLAEK
jgi:hypothetical protein